MKAKLWAIVLVAIPVLGIVMLPGPSPVVSAAADGAALYRSKCASCHGADGKGETAYGKKIGLRDLGSAAVQGQSDAQLAAITGKGKGKMPGYEASLGADGVKAVVAYIRTLKH